VIGGTTVFILRWKFRKLGESFATQNNVLCVSILETCTTCISLGILFYGLRPKPKDALLQKVVTASYTRCTKSVVSSASPAQSQQTHRSEKKKNCWSGRDNGRSFKKFDSFYGTRNALWNYRIKFVSFVKYFICPELTAVECAELNSNSSVYTRRTFHAGARCDWWSNGLVILC
jgi:hypothetical protein